VRKSIKLLEKGWSNENARGGEMCLINGWMEWGRKNTLMTHHPHPIWYGDGLTPIGLGLI
jgi:hypothetical protein